MVEDEVQETAEAEPEAPEASAPPARLGLVRVRRCGSHVMTGVPYFEPTKNQQRVCYLDEREREFDLAPHVARAVCATGAFEEVPGAGPTSLK